MEALDERSLAEKVLSSLGEESGHVRALVLFGSRATGEEPSWASDLDLLVVLDDGCCEEDVKAVWSRLSWLGRSPRPKGVLGHLFWSLEKATGMFHSPFVCREKDLKDLDFRRIFGTSQVLTALMAPSEIVLGSVLRTCKVIYGSLPKGLSPPARREALQLLRNLVVCFSLAFGASFFCPITDLALKYVLEALKWTVYAVSYYTSGRIGPLSELVRAFGVRSPWPWPKLAKEFLRLRKKLASYGPVLLMALPGVLNLHLAALGQRMPELSKSEGTGRY